MTATRCPECGATYANAADSCAARFEALLALDHSRREPWGSRHGQAFAAHALQIADLADFAAAAYPERLDAWCRATLASWGVDPAPIPPDGS